MHGRTSVSNRNAQKIYCLKIIKVLEGLLSIPIQQINNFSKERYYEKYKLLYNNEYYSFYL